MKQRLSTIFLLIIILFSINDKLNASHCYSYTTKHSFDLITQGDSIYLQETIKDANNVTYVLQRKINLKGVVNKDFNIVSKDGRNILFMADGYYYLVSKNFFQVENYGINKLFPISNVTEIVGNCFFLIHGKWHYVVPNEYSDKLVDKILLPLKGKIEILANYDRGETLLKDANMVYVFYESSATLKPIPNLTAASTLYRESDYLYGEHFLYDDDTFYLTTIRFIYRDVTPSFAIFGKHDGFNKVEFSVSNKVSLDTKDGLIWMYLSGGLRVDNEETVFFYPLQATYLNSYKDLYVYNDSIYKDNIEAINKFRPLDTSIIKDLKTFHCNDFGYNYSDSLASYIFDIEANHLIETTHHISKVDSLKADPHTHFKQFALGYTYDDKIAFNYAAEIKNTANTTKIEFIGSTVDIINLCDQRSQDGNWFKSVEVLYNYFFKDDQHIYFYQTGQPGLSIIDDALPDDYKIDNYDDLVKLTQLAENLRVKG